MNRRELLKASLVLPLAGLLKAETRPGTRKVTAAEIELYGKMPEVMPWYTLGFVNPKDETPENKAWLIRSQNPVIDNSPYVGRRSTLNFKSSEAFISPCESDWDLNLHTFSAEATSGRDDSRRGTDAMRAQTISKNPK